MNLQTMSINKKFNFRQAEHGDIKAVREMIQELADFENMPNGPQLTEEDLIRDAGLNGDPNICHIYILELLQDQTTESNCAHVPVGYAICYFTYSTWQGKCYFLEDIYVKPKYRGMGAGKRILCEVAAVAKAYKCKRVGFNVLSWNPAQEFYKKMGASDLTVKESWHLYRLNETEINKLALELTHT